MLNALRENKPFRGKILFGRELSQIKNCLFEYLHVHFNSITCDYKKKSFVTKHKKWNNFKVLNTNFSVTLCAIKLQGVPVTISAIKLQGVPVCAITLQGVSVGAIKLQGVPVCPIKLQGVSACAIKLQGVSVCAIKLQGVSICAIKLQGVLNVLRVCH